MVAISLEDLKADSDFIKGGFWSGELFVDTKKHCYKDLGFKSPSVMSTLKAVSGSKAFKAKYAQARREQGTIGNLKGDFSQNGGILVVGAGGKGINFKWIQERVVDYPPFEEIFKVLGIDEPLPAAIAEMAGAAKKAVCEDDVCTR